MPLASNKTPESRFMALFVGPKHSGKTVAACSWVREGKMAKVDDFDGRIDGILGAPWIDPSKVEYNYYPPRLIEKDSKPFFQRLNASLEADLVLCQTNKNTHSLYVGDSITALNKNLLMDSIPLSHAEGRGKRIGGMSIADPGDYNFVTNNINNYLTHLRSMAIDIIVTAHVVPKWDKPRDDYGNKLQYADNIQVGEKLSLTDKLAADVPNYFNHIFRFDRQIINNEERFFVEYISDLACTSFPGLKPGRFDITGKNFKEFTLNLTNTKTQSDKEKEILTATK